MFWVSRSFGSRGHLHLSSSMNAQQGKDTSLAYLKVVVHLLNENLDELDLKVGRSLCLEDLDRLDSYQMLRIVTFLLREVVGDKAICKPTQLVEFNKFGVGMVSYDSGIDQIYHAVKSIFPEDSDLFHYSVLLLPSSNPKRTKLVISYIMSFVLMCDNLEERFSTCFNEILAENEEKVAICNEVDDLKDKICAKIQEKETEKERLPTLQKELQSLEENIRKLQKVLAKLNSEVEKHKATYESKELETKNLEQQLERINMERLALEQQIVTNPNEIRSENESIKKQLESETRSREGIGAELEKCAKECDVFESLIKRANHLIQSYESVIAQMENTKCRIEYYMKTGNEMTSASRKIELQKQELRKLSEQHAEKLAEVNSMKEKNEAALEGIQNEMLKTKGQIVQTKDLTKTLISEAHEAYRSVYELSQKLEKVKKEISTCMYNVIIVLPQKRSEQEAEAVKILSRIKENFKYPMPDFVKL